MTDDRYRDWDAAYVLGSLPTDERLEYERHLETCPSCREAVAELAGMPGILGRLTAADAVALDGVGLDGGGLDGGGLDGGGLDAVAPDEPAGSGAGPAPVRPLQEIAHRVGRRRRRRRVLAVGIAALAVVLAVIGGIAVGTATTTTTEEAGTAHVMRPVLRPAVLTADLRVTAKAWGTRLDWSCAYGAGGWGPGTSAEYDLVVTRDDGSESTVATWSATGARAGDLAAATGIPEASIRSVDIRLHGEDQPLVRTRL